MEVFGSAAYWAAPSGAGGQEYAAGTRGEILRAAYHRARIDVDREMRGIGSYDQEVAPLLAALGFPGRSAAATPPQPKRKGLPVAGDTVIQHWTVKIDLKSDDSPEGIAVKFLKGVERAQRFPTRSTRAPQVSPRPTTLR
jgi:hypothetical protein